MRLELERLRRIIKMVKRKRIVIFLRKVVVGRAMNDVLIVFYRL